MFIFCSVSVAEWPPFYKIAANSVDHMFSLYFDFLQYKLFPVLVLMAGFGF